MHVGPRRASARKSAEPRERISFNTAGLRSTYENAQRQEQLREWMRNRPEHEEHEHEEPEHEEP